MAVFVGVLHAELYIPGARTLKERRRAVSSVTDRVRHRFDCAAALVGESDSPQQQALAVTVVGNDGRLLESVLDQIRHYLQRDAEVLVHGVDVDVSRWHGTSGWWSQQENDDG
ncbi:MAG: DUF503 domain-containing protein [Deltaproteobacteria bacterium]|nr:MAG: DUF503 domain-containing protein [Deltaproteobacteria bacterium]